MYEVDEGRPVWKLRPVMLLVTIVALTLIGCAAAMVGDQWARCTSDRRCDRGGETPPRLSGISLAGRWCWCSSFSAVAILYYATPNIQQPKFRWISGGAALAIVVWILASVGFGFYVANFSSYNKTYGSLAGAIVFLLWLWITNLALLFGAELDSELERGRQLQAGIARRRTTPTPAQRHSRLGQERPERRRRGRTWARVASGAHLRPR